MLNFLDGKKTILSLAVTAIGLGMGVDVSEAELAEAINAASDAVASVGIVLALLSRIVSNGKPFFQA